MAGTLLLGPPVEPVEVLENMTVGPGYQAPEVVVVFLFISGICGIENKDYDWEINFTLFLRALSHSGCGGSERARSGGEGSWHGSSSIVHQGLPPTPMRCREEK